MDIIAFGIGEKGKNAISMLERDYNILFFVDNDKNKWGTVFNGYQIKPPDEIEKYNCNIVVTAGNKYAGDIVRQLKQIGVSRDRIFFCHQLSTNSKEKFEVYSMNAEMTKITEIPLIQYDLYKEEDRETSHKKVLIFCAFFSTYAQQLIENMSKRYEDIEFSLLTYAMYAEEYKEKIPRGQLKHIYCVQSMADLKTILEEIPIYDAMQLLWIEAPWVYVHKYIRKKAKRLNLNVGGSDFYRAQKDEKEYKRNIIACSDYITAETKATVYEFELYYGTDAKGKTDLLPFGIEVLDYINCSENIPVNEIKKKFHIPENKIVITCGHNAKSEHQHKKLIETLKQLPETTKKQIICVFPMTYPAGYDSYISSVKTQLEESGLEYLILTEFMDFRDMAEYALVSDIMIHVQTTDQLSSTMLEEMYAGSIVIAGKWLPYQSLHEMGMFFIDAETILNVKECLEDVIKNIDKYKKKCIENKDIIWNHSSWDKLAPRWYKLWS